MDGVDCRPAPGHRVITAAGDAHSTGMQSYLRMMAVRLLEMRPVLAPHGSIYLRCDDTAGAYLRMLMDAVFGCGTFRNEIVWKRSERSDGRRFGRTHDTILAYAHSHEATWNNVRVPYSKDYIDRFYREKDNRGRYKRVDLTGAGTRTGESGESWRGRDPTESGPWNT